MLKHKITTQPTSEPITLAQAKLHLRVTDTDLDSNIEQLIKSAREHAEAVTGKAYIVRTITAVCDSFPTKREIELPVGPLVEVDSITYTDEDGNSATFTDFTADDFSSPPRIVLNSSASWPTVALAPVNPIQIVYRAGFEEESEIPETIKRAMYLLIGHWYENGQEVISGTQPFTVPFAAEMLLQQQRHPGT